jgi:hypothetical protein
MNIAEDGEARNGDVSSNVEQESQLIVEHNNFQLMDLIALCGKADKIFKHYT